MRACQDETISLPTSMPPGSQVKVTVNCLIFAHAQYLSAIQNIGRCKHEIRTSVFAHIVNNKTVYKVCYKSTTLGAGPHVSNFTRSTFQRGAMAGFVHKIVPKLRRFIGF